MFPLAASGRRVGRWAASALVVLLAAPPSGFAAAPPLTPSPLPPWVTALIEKKFFETNDFRTPILPPIRAGAPPPVCEDPPEESDILRALPKVPRGVPYVCEEFRGNVQIVTE